MPLVLATANPDKAREIVEIFVPSTPTAVASTSELVARRPARRRRARRRSDVEDRRRRSRRTRASRRSRCATPPGCPRSPTTPVSRSTRSTARPACTPPGYAGEHATYADNVAKLLDELRDVPGPERTARFAHGRAGPLARRARGRGDRRGRGHDRRRGTGRRRVRLRPACSCRSRATAARSRR